MILIVAYDRDNTVSIVEIAKIQRPSLMNDNPLNSYLQFVNTSNKHSFSCYFVEKLTHAKN